MRYFDHFDLFDVFPNCSDVEITSALKGNYVDNLLFLLQFLDSFRDFVATPIIITSGYRDVEHNKKVGGVWNSQHLLGQAIDFYSPKMPHESLVCFFHDFIKKSALDRFIGQVIIYKTFIHVGLRTPSHPKLTIYDKRKN